MDGDPGPCIGRGRDCDVFDLGNGRALRRSRTGASSEAEAATITHVRAHGYPAPEVFDVDGPDMVMALIDGTTMADAAIRTPWRVTAHARLLAALANQLASVPPPPHLLPPAFEGGEVLAHMDLHPLNVMLAGRAPVVIDWTNAAIVPRGTETANTWLTIAAGQTDDNTVVRFFIDRFRRRFVEAFLADVDRAAAEAALPIALANRLTDNNLSDGEKATMQEVVAAVHRARPH